MQKLKFLWIVIVMLLSFVFFVLLFPPEEVITIGVVDRIVDEKYAVILIEADGIQIEMLLEELELIVEEQMVVELVSEKGEFRLIATKELATGKRQSAAGSLLERLQTKHQAE